MSRSNGASVGPSISKEEREKARERRKQDQREQQTEQAARSISQSAATQQGTAAPGYWDVIGKSDLDHPAWGDSLEAFASGELSRVFALGNLTQKEFENLQLRIENEFWQIKNEMRGPGSELEDDDMRMLYGGDRPDLDDSKARRLRAAEEEKKMRASLSKDARGLRSGTEIHAVARTEDSEDAEADGMFSGLSSYLGG